MLYITHCYQDTIQINQYATNKPISKTRHAHKPLLPKKLYIHILTDKPSTVHLKIRLKEITTRFKRKKIPFKRDMVLVKSNFMLKDYK